VGAIASGAAKRLPKSSVSRLRLLTSLYSLDKSTEPAYLRLAGEQDSGQALVANSFEKIVQKKGG
jgi:hypothetical protein